MNKLQRELLTGSVDAARRWKDVRFMDQTVQHAIESLTRANDWRTFTLKYRPSRGDKQGATMRVNNAANFLAACIRQRGIVQAELGLI